ncbi:MAG: KH domain-containing protein [Deinococcus sp.]|nr:KH domain-containing protein [Deinococcus sp.]
MDEKKRGLDDLLTDLGIGDGESPPEPLIKEEAAETLVAPPAAPVAGSPKEALSIFMLGLLRLLDPAYSVDIREDGEQLRAEVLGGDLGRLIGKEGRTLRALEFVANVALAKQYGNVYRVVLDAAGYRRRQEDRVQKIAQDATLQVEVSGEPVALPPMPSNERRIIHVLLKHHPRVTTISVGEGEERHVVVLPREAGEPVSETQEEH